MPALRAVEHLDVIEGGSLAARFSIGVTRCTLPDAGVPARVGRNHLGFPVNERVLPASGQTAIALGYAAGKGTLAQRQACHLVIRRVITGQKERSPKLYGICLVTAASSQYPANFSLDSHLKRTITVTFSGLTYKSCNLSSGGVPVPNNSCDLSCSTLPDSTISVTLPVVVRL